LVWKRKRGRSVHSQKSVGYKQLILQKRWHKENGCWEKKEAETEGCEARFKKTSVR
jgi:hypothetical protein